MYAIRSYYGTLDSHSRASSGGLAPVSPFALDAGPSPGAASWDAGEDLLQVRSVITSYSIHYTKLYEGFDGGGHAQQVFGFADAMVERPVAFPDTAEIGADGHQALA